MSKDDKRLKCFNCERRKGVLYEDWRAAKEVADSKGAWLEVACGHCFEAMVGDTEGHDTQDMTAAEMLAELLLPPARRRWRWIQRFDI